MKVCTCCHRELDESYYSKDATNKCGFRSICRECNGAYQKIYQQRIKANVMSHYGGRCVCCGETELVFLTIDHISGGGTKQRKETGPGTAFYRWLQKNDYPIGYQVLCHNCNFAKTMGPCPHTLGE
jgi:hypothetical protein